MTACDNTGAWDIDFVGECNNVGCCYAVMCIDTYYVVCDKAYDNAEVDKIGNAKGE